MVSLKYIRNVDQSWELCSLSTDTLVDLISDLHSTQQQTSLNPPSWADIERIVKKRDQYKKYPITFISIAHMPHMTFHDNPSSMQDVCPMNLV